MAKKGKAKVIQMLSPENYIRQKARTLSIYECRVNVGWNESKMATVLVARKHTNGNITVGIYLVDLACLGVKDTFWHFNIPLPEYREIMNHLMEMDEGTEKIDYVLAHNIVYAGIEFAGEYEFKPHKDFTSVTRFILEEDNKNVPLIEIECGINGLPSYMQGPLDNDVKARQVIAQLERVAGKGNYYLINEDEEIFNLYDDNNRNIDDDDDDDPFENMSFEDKRDEFEKYYKRLDRLNEDEKESFFELRQSLTSDLLDYDSFEEYLDAFTDELDNIEVNGDEIPDEMLGVEPGETQIPDKVKQLFFDMIDYIEDPVKIRKMLSGFQKNHGVEAAAEYISLLVERYNNSEKFGNLLQAALKKYPRYGLMRMLKTETEITSPELPDPDLIKNIPCHYDDFFQGRKSIHPWEFFNYINLRTLFIILDRNLEKIEAWREITDDFLPEEVDYSMIDNMIELFEVTLLASRLNIKK